MNSAFLFIRFFSMKEEVYITLCPNWIQWYSKITGKVKFKINTKKSIELLSKWGLPMNAFTLLRLLPEEDQKWIKAEVLRVVDERVRASQAIKTRLTSE